MNRLPRSMTKRYCSESLVITRNEESRELLAGLGVRAEVGTDAAEKAKSGGEPVRLDPMNPFERKVVHDAVAAAGLTSESEGAEPRRYVVVLPA